MARRAGMLPVQSIVTERLARGLFLPSDISARV